MAQIILKRALKKIFVVVFLLLLLLAFYWFALWVALDFDPYFLEIDRCMDHGGRWDDLTKSCEY